MNIKDFIENMKGCEYITFTLPNVGEATIDTIECQEIVDVLEKWERKEVLVDKFGYNECPNHCKDDVLISKGANYCNYCGQRLKWEE